LKKKKKKDLEIFHNNSAGLQKKDLEKKKFQKKKDLENFQK
jgi:hypothetical protein